MSTPELVTVKYVKLQSYFNIDERWLSDRLVEDPSLLGLGDLQVRDIERRQPGAGRLDLLLYDPESLTRYEVEIQLCPTDESHLVRTIEYWDIERRRYPQYDHVAVIVAEDITSRFLNVISLFNGFIPLIAIQLKGIEVNGSFALVPTKILDVFSQGTEEEDAGEKVDRVYWERKASVESLKVMNILVSKIRTVEPGINPNYTKYYIGLASSSGPARNFVTFRPKKSDYVLTHFKIPEDEDLTSDLVEIWPRYPQVRFRKLSSSSL